MPKVSVVIPTYNNAHYIRAALDSVLAQSMSDYEVIVIDDGSTDGTREIIEAYGKGVRYHWQENGGLAVARNTGLRLATGQMLTYLDADDIWEPANLEVKTAVLDQHQDVGGVFSEFSIFDDEGPRQPRGTRQMFPFFDRTGLSLSDVLTERRSAALPDGRTVDLLAGHVFDWLFWGNFILPTSMVFRVEPARETGTFRPELRTQQDYEYWLRFTRRVPLAHVDQPLVRYRRHARQLTDHSRIENILRAVESIIRQYEADFTARGRTYEYRRRLGGVQLELSKVYLGQGRRREARARLRASIALTPANAYAYAAFAASLVPATWLSAIRQRT